jgi:hypothetical protein
MGKQRQHNPAPLTTAAAVEVIDKIREGLVEFLRTSSSDDRATACLVEAYRAEARAALRRIFSEPLASPSVADEGSSSDGFSVIDHLRDRKVIHTWSKQQLARQRRELLLAQASSPSPSADQAEITQPSPIPPTSNNGGA